MTSERSEKLARFPTPELYRFIKTSFLSVQDLIIVVNYSGLRVRISTPCKHTFESEHSPEPIYLASGENLTSFIVA